MYVPKVFEQTRLQWLRDLIRAHPLATLVTLSDGEPVANHIPLSLSVPPGSLGTLSGHVALANPLWRTLHEPTAALAIFHGPETYISPSWYPTKRETGRVVPTWNYAVVHARGPIRAIRDHGWLLRHLRRLVADNERGRTVPWSIDDAPPAFIDGLLGSIVGIEIDVRDLTGKSKMSQNQPAANRAGVIRGLQASGSPRSREVAAMIPPAD